MRAKRASPLSKFGTDPRVAEIDKTHISLIEGLTSYRNWSDAACKSLLAERETECAKLESQIRTARALQFRSQPSVQQDLEALKCLDVEIRQQSEQEQRAQENLEQMEQSRTSSFLTAINKVLSDFGAGFTLKDLESKLTNTRVNSDFEIALLEGGQIRASSKRDGEPRVGTVLSEGDRTTLALAIFIATTLGSGDVVSYSMIR